MSDKYYIINQSKRFGGELTEIHSLKYRIADMNITLEMRYPFTARQCADYRIPDSSPTELTVFAEDEEIKREMLLTENRFGEPYCESVCLYRKLCHIMPSVNRVMFHSSVVSVDGEGYAFFGRSGAGKSTHTMLWKQLLGDRLTVVNGDKPIYYYNGKHIIAYGSPWCGKENLQTNTSVGLKAICLIKQAKENAIRKLSPDEAAQVIISQVLMPKDALCAAATVELLDKLVQCTDIWELECNVSLDAARLSYNSMKGNNNINET